MYAKEKKTRKKRMKRHEVDIISVLWEWGLWGRLERERERGCIAVAVAASTCPLLPFSVSVLIPNEMECYFPIQIIILALF